MSSFLSWRCSQCEQSKPWDAFTKRTNPGGRQVPQNPCKQCKKVMRQNRHRDNPEEAKRNRDRLLAKDPDYFRRWASEHREVTRAYTRRYRAKNVSASRARGRRYARTYYSKYPERVMQHNYMRRASRYAVGAEIVDRYFVWRRDQGICGICHRAADIHRWHLDHVLPISKGGAHIYANVQVSHPACNVRKKDKIVSCGS